MNNVLLLTNGIGPAEGAILSNLKMAGHEVLTYNVAGQWYPRQQTVPFWMRGYRTRISPMARNWFNRVIAPKNIDRVITSGLDAAAFAAHNTNSSFYPLLWRGDLDFSPRNQTLTEGFADLTRSSDRLLLEDPWEMDKAVSKSSQVTHLRMRYPTPPARNYLSVDTRRVAILYPPSDFTTAEEILDAARTSFGAKVDVELVNINALYQAKDLAKGLDFYETLKLRLREYSFAIFLGTGPHHSTVLRALQYDKEKIVVDQTIGMAFLSDQLDLPHRARKLRCVQIMKEILEADDSVADVREDFKSPELKDDYLQSLDLLWRQQFDRHYEELPAVDNNQQLNVFFSVAALQDLTTGARPQRIRNMHGAFSDRFDSLSIFGAQPFFERRLNFALQLIDEGRAAGTFYGENSTTPMTPDLSQQLAGFLQKFSNAGGRSMWFVRDLHWLESFEKSPWSQERRAELKTHGLHELQAISKTVDHLAAPSLRAGEGFNQLISEVGGESHDWIPLPPAVQPQNIIDDSTTVAKSDGITVLYSGGISEIYGMNLYLSALAEISDDILADFVVREAETEPLRIALEQLELLDSARARILHTTMDLYRSRTKRTIGVVLLDSDYAKFSFPYKTVTMIERGYPILCFSDMGIADFVTSNNLGVVTERSAESIRDGIRLLIDKSVPGLPATRANETWAARVKLIEEVLRVSQTSPNV